MNDNYVPMGCESCQHLLDGSKMCIGCNVLDDDGDSLSNWSPLTNLAWNQCGECGCDREACGSCAFFGRVKCDEQQECPQEAADAIPAPVDDDLIEAGIALEDNLAAKVTGGGMKYDGGKDRWDLLDGVHTVLKGVARVLTFGAQKYAADSWQQVPDAKARYWAAACRHRDYILDDELYDSESGLPHWAHFACDCLFVAWFMAKDAALTKFNRYQK